MTKGKSGTAGERKSDGMRLWGGREGAVKQDHSKQEGEREQWLEMSIKGLIACNKPLTLSLTRNQRGNSITRNTAMERGGERNGRR